MLLRGHSNAVVSLLESSQLCAVGVWRPCRAHLCVIVRVAARAALCQVLFTVAQADRHWRRSTWCKMTASSSTGSCGVSASMPGLREV